MANRRFNSHLLWLASLTLAAFFALLLIWTYPAAAEPPRAIANLVDGNSAILVEVYGDGSAQITQVILVTPQGEEIRAASLNSSTNTETRTTTSQSGGGGPTVGLGVGTGYVNRQGHGNDYGYNSVGVGIGVPLFGGGGGQTTQTETITTTKTDARITLPQPMHYLQLWQDYRLEVVYQEAGVEKVLNVPTPRPRSAN